MNIMLGDFILAPRPRYSVEEVSYEPQLNSTSSDTCSTTDCVTGGTIKNWEVTLKVHCIGNGDIDAARNAYKKLEQALADLCGGVLKKYSRQYCTEAPLELYIARAYVKPINLDWLATDPCCVGSLSGEVHLISADINTGVLPMQYDYNILKPQVV